MHYSSHMDDVGHRCVKSGNRALMFQIVLFGLHFDSSELMPGLNCSRFQLEVVVGIGDQLRIFFPQISLSTSVPSSLLFTYTSATLF